MRFRASLTLALVVAAVPGGTAAADPPIKDKATFESTQALFNSADESIVVANGEQTERVRIKTKKNGEQDIRFRSEFKGVDEASGTTVKTRDESKMRTKDGSLTVDQRASQDVKPTDTDGRLKVDRRVKTSTDQSTGETTVQKDRFRVKCGSKPC